MGTGGVTLSHLTSHKHPISQLIRELKDDMTVILLLGVSFMSVTPMLFSSHTVFKAFLIFSTIVLHST